MTMVSLWQQWFPAEARQQTHSELGLCLLMLANWAKIPRTQGCQMNAAQRSHEVQLTAPIVQPQWMSCFELQAELPNAVMLLPMIQAGERLSLLMAKQQHQ